MKNKYLLVLFFIIRCLFLNADIAFGNSIYNAKNNNLNILLKKYDISLAKPEIIPLNSNINKTIAQRKTVRPNHIAKYRYIYNKYNKRVEKHTVPDFLMQKVSLVGRGSVKSALMLLSRETGVPVIFYGGFPAELKNDVYYKAVPL